LVGGVCLKEIEKKKKLSESLFRSPVLLLLLLLLLAAAQLKKTCLFKQLISLSMTHILRMIFHFFVKRET
jgi:hypothetical protein